MVTPSPSTAAGAVTISPLVLIFSLGAVRLLFLAYNIMGLVKPPSAPVTLLLFHIPMLVPVEQLYQAQLPIAELEPVCLEAEAELLIQALPLALRLVVTAVEAAAPVAGFLSATVLVTA
jgi:hypothetical protein